MAVATMGSRMIGVVASVFVARLLHPRDFGAVAMAMILVSITKLFSGLGLGNALIHSRLDKRKIAFQAFVVTVLASLLLFLIVNAAPSFFAALLGDPEVTPVIRWLSALIILDALSLVPTALLKKEMMFEQVSKSVLISEALYNGVALGLAFLDFGLWSLVYAQLANSLTKLLIVWIAYPGWDWLIPKHWDWGAMKSLLRYGIQSTGSSLLSFFNSNWDDWLVGRVLGSTSLGFYTKAYSLTNKTIAGFNRSVINSVLFPSYSKIQDEKERLSRFYIKSLSMVALIMAPLSMGVLIIAAELIPILLGEKWVPMVPTLQIFAFMALVRPLAGSTAPLFQAVGHPDFNLRAGLVLLVVMAPLMFLLLNRGIAGVAVAVTVSYAVGFVYNIYQVHKVLPGTASKMVPAILPALFASCTMMLGVQLSKAPLLRFAGGQYNWVSLGAMIAIGAVIYILTAFLVQRALILETVRLLMSVFKGRRRMTFNKHQAG